MIIRTFFLIAAVLKWVLNPLYLQYANLAMLDNIVIPSLV